MFKKNDSFFVSPETFLQMKDAYLQIPTEEIGIANVYRSSDGVAHAISNSCAHRGMALHDEPIGQARLACRYHGWRYCNRGHVKPNRVVGRNVEIALPKVELSKYGGFVANGEIDKAELDAVLKLINCEVDINPIHFECMPHNSNWKWLVENVLEAYHLDFVHRKSFVEQGFEMTSDIVNERIGDSSTMFLPKKRFGRGFYKHGYVFPNLFLSNTSDFITFCSIVMPLSIDRTNLYWFLYPGKKMGSLPGEMQNELALQAINFTRKVLAEDKEMVEAQQRGSGAENQSRNLTKVEPRIQWFYESLQKKGIQ
ncbi:Rieske 2Fe-2S domain-containing protein [Planktomarina temperata]|nr:Rieske 2Fe-2S domain-containing protein [bacterium]MDB2459378.1 Rieske 2Fe-2S domain-containing protein [Planktomarina temperata]